MYIRVSTLYMYIYMHVFLHCTFVLKEPSVQVWLLVHLMASLAGHELPAVQAAGTAVCRLRSEFRKRPRQSRTAAVGLERTL